MGISYGKHPEKDSSAVKKRREGLENLYENLCDNGVIDFSLFKEHFYGPSSAVVDNLFNLYFVDLVNPLSQTKALFVDRCNHILEKNECLQIQTAHFLFDLITKDCAHLTPDDLKNIIRTCCIFGIHQLWLDDESFIAPPEKEIGDIVIDSIVLSLLDGKESVSRDEVVNWIHLNYSAIFGGLSSWLQHRLTGIIDKSKFEMLPQPMECTSSNFLLTPSCLWFLCCSLPSCYTYMENKFKVYDEEQDTEDTMFTWNLLYNSNQHGLSLNRFKHKVMEYKSPTVTLIKFSSGLIIALGLDEQWIDSPEKYGGPYCQLIELAPSVTVVESSSKMVYLKENGRAIPTGLLIGSCNKRPEVKISTDLNTAELYYKDLLEEQVDIMEVWGCGGVDALKSQEDVKKWEQKETERRKKVKLPGQWDADKTILEMGGVRCDHSERGDM